MAGRTRGLSLGSRRHGEPLLGAPRRIGPAAAHERANLLRALPGDRRHARRLCLRRRDRRARPARRRAGTGRDRDAVGRTANRAPLRRCGRFAGELRSLARRQGAGLRLARARLHDAAVGSRGHRVRRGDRRAPARNRVAARRHAGGVRRRHGRIRADRGRAGRCERAGGVRDGRRLRPDHGTRRIALRRPARVRQPPSRAVRPRRGRRAEETRHQQSLALHRPRLLARRPLARLRVGAEIEHDDRAHRRRRERHADRRHRTAARGPRAGLGSRRQVSVFHLGARLQPDLRRAAIRLELPARDAAVRRNPAARRRRTRSSPVPAPLHRAKDDDDEDDDADDGAAKRKARAHNDRRRGIAAAHPGVSGRRRQLRAHRRRQGARDLLALSGARHQSRETRLRRGGGRDARRLRLRAQRSATLAADVDDFVLGSDARTWSTNRTPSCARSTPAANFPTTNPKTSPPAR